MAKQDEPKAPETAADVVKNVQKEIGNVGDLADAPVTPELQDAKDRLVAAAADARTRAATEYPFMVYDKTDAKRTPRIVHTDEEYNAAIDDGYDDDPGVTEHGRGDNAEERAIRDRAEAQARQELAKDEIKAKIEADQANAEKASQSGRSTSKGGKK